MQSFEVDAAEPGAERQPPRSPWMRRGVTTLGLIGVVAMVSTVGSGRSRTHAAHSVSLATWWGSNSNEDACPRVETVSDFNVTEYLRASWFIQKQQINAYQPEENLFCVVATYNETYRGAPSTVPFFDGLVVTVFNNCNRGGVNEGQAFEHTDPDFERGLFSTLCARQPDPTRPERLTVAPCFLPNFFGGDYWVLDAGPFPDNYQYAIVIAGQPTQKMDDGLCTTPEICSGISQSGCGLWLFTREPVPDESVVLSMENSLRRKGISSQLLKDVKQSGCTYDGYFLKGNEGPEALV